MIATLTHEECVTMLMEVYYTSPWVPAEWIKAHGLEPRGVWHDLLLAPSRTPSLKAGVCAIAESVIQVAESSTDAAVVFSTHCDQMRRAFDVVAASERRRIFLFNLPATWQSPVARRMYESEVERLGRFLEELGGCAPKAESLSTIAAQYAQARESLLEAAPWCASRRFAEALARFRWDGSVDLPSHHESSAAPFIPLALVGGPWPSSQWNLLDGIDASGARVVVNATEAGERSLWPASGSRNLDRDPIRALVQDYLDHCVDVFQRPNTRLYIWLKERLAARRVRGIVLWLQVGCDLWRAEAQRLREVFGLPLLVLDTDETGSCASRNASRIQAFVELLSRHASA